jgi:hypothetical protein
VTGGFPAIENTVEAKSGLGRGSGAAGEPDVRKFLPWLISVAFSL